MSTLKVTNLQHPSASNPGLQLDASGVCYQLGMRNVLINGNPLVNQRGYVSGTATTGANEYTVDRWRVVVLGESIVFSDSNNVRTVTAPAGGVEQVVEGANLLSETYTLSWTGTATATVDGNPVTNGGQVTLTGGTNATVRFINGTFSLAQLERGSVATPFEHRSFGDELARCQRYYCKTFNYDQAPAQNAGTDGALAFIAPAVVAADIMWRYPVELRASPTTVTTYSTNAASANWSTNTDSPTASVNRAGALGLTVRASTPGGAGRTYSIHASAEAEL